MRSLPTGDQSDQKLALHNIASMVRPGGVLIIDHRNYDYILETGKAPQGKNIYYKVLKHLRCATVCETIQAGFVFFQLAYFCFTPCLELFWL